MAITRKAFNEALAKIASENGLSEDLLQKQISSIVPQPSPFASKSAKTLASENDIKPSDIKGSGKLGKITSDDIRKYIGEPVKNKSPTEWSSKTAETLASENDLTPSDFPVKGRTGRTWKNGTVTISVTDVKNKLGLSTTPKKSPFASKAAKKLAKDNKIKSSEIDGTGKDGKITKSDIESYLKNNQDEDESSSSSSDEEN